MLEKKAFDLVELCGIDKESRGHHRRCGPGRVLAVAPTLVTGGTGNKEDRGV